LAHCLERRRHGSPKRATRSTAPSESREHVPAAVRREVYERDGGSCAFVGEGGRRCGSKVRLEYQHVIPRAVGGPSTSENLTLFCRAHNLLQAKRDFGDEHVKRKQLERSAVSALVQLGYKRRQAEDVVGIAIQQLPDPRALS
jgi:5-methylcytosine-specific restriction endonuclease McrA